MTNTLQSRSATLASHRPPVRIRVSAIALTLVIAAACLAVPGNTVSAAGGLEGYWSGGGWVSFAGGSRERARCRVRFWTQSATRYALSAVCATESGRVSQEAVVHKTGGSTYAGSFYNREYDVTGTIHITQRVNSLSATLNSSSGSAALSFNR